jgi:hypothetical protein
MIVAKKWVAAGSTATLLAGGLFLGAPAATAAPGDAVCLDASVQFNAALGAAGIDLAFVSQLEVAVANIVSATENFLAVTVELDLEGLSLAADEAVLAADAAGEEYITAQAAADVAFESSVFVDAEGNPAPESDPAVIDLQILADAAYERSLVADGVAEAAVAAFNGAIATDAYVTAEANLDAAALEADTLIAQLGGDDVLAAEIVSLFKAFLAACDAGAIGVDPATPIAVPVAPVAPVGPGVTPVGPAPVAPEVVVVTPAPVVVAPVTGTNKGLNVQTAVNTEDNSAAVTLIAALLAVGVAVPVATGARMRRLERAQR